MIQAITTHLKARNIARSGAFGAFLDLCLYGLRQLALVTCTPFLLIRTVTGQLWECWWPTGLIDLYNKAINHYHQLVAFITL